MRRWITGAASAVGLVAALAVGPLGAASAVPYVYGCTPATINSPSTYLVDMFIYNGSATTANLTTKILDGHGNILNNDPGAIGVTFPLTWTLAPTHTIFGAWIDPATSYLGENAINIPASLRIVSNVPVSAALSLKETTADAIMVACTPQPQ